MLFHTPLPVSHAPSTGTLTGTEYVHVQAIPLAVAVGVELRLHPEVMVDPLRRIGEGGNLTIPSKSVG